MQKKTLALLATLYAAASCAAVDVNQASAAELDGVKGIGPPTSRAILAERARGGPFRSWDDLMARVKGIRAAKAKALSREGLSVDGAAYPPPAAAPAPR